MENDLDNRLRQLLEQLSEKLCDVIAESPDVGDKLAEIRGAGYSLHLLLDCKRRRSESGWTLRRPLAPAPPGTFRINAADLTLLRSLGIDPTRRCRSRRSRVNPEDSTNAASEPTATD